MAKFNAYTILCNMPAWYYFDRPTHLAFHDLTQSQKPPPNLRSLLGLGMKFIPTPSYTTTSSSITNSTIERFERNLYCKTFFARPKNEEDEEDFDPKLYIPSGWSPPDWKLPDFIKMRLQNFSHVISNEFKKRRSIPNLLPHQSHALLTLQNMRDKLLIVHCDKNLGPAVIDRKRYINLCFNDHLNSITTYEQLSQTAAGDYAKDIRNEISKWIQANKSILDEPDLKFLRWHLNHNKKPFPSFYTTMKVHKEGQLKTRPIVSCSGSLLFALGIWIDRKLQTIAKQQRSYFKNSKQLKDLLLQLDLPPNSVLFKADAVSMYTNINTTKAINSIASYLRQHEEQFQHIDRKALITALTLVMTNNVFTFGDTYWLQKTGTAMGTPPAPPYANLYYAIHEETFLDSFPGRLLFYRRFIDDIIGIWLPHPDDAINSEEWNRVE